MCEQQNNTKKSTLIIFLHASLARVPTFSASTLSVSIFISISTIQQHLLARSRRCVRDVSREIDCFVETSSQLGQSTRRRRKRDVGFDNLFRWFLPEDDVIFSISANKIKSSYFPSSAFHCVPTRLDPRRAVQNFRVFENGYGVSRRAGDKVGRVDQQVVPVTKINRRRSIVSVITYSLFWYQCKLKPCGSYLLLFLFKQRMADVTAALKSVAVPSSIRPIHWTENLACAIDSK